MCNKGQNRNQDFANEAFIVLVLFIILAIILGAVLV